LFHFPTLLSFSSLFSLFFVLYYSPPILLLILYFFHNAPTGNTIWDSNGASPWPPSWKVCSREPCEKALQGLTLRHQSFSASWKRQSVQFHLSWQHFSAKASFNQFRA
jgi:hypothetical protein